LILGSFEKWVKPTSDNCLIPTLKAETSELL
jgi:hypothetical protein